MIFQSKPTRHPKRLDAPIYDEVLARYARHDSAETLATIASASPYLAQLLLRHAEFIDGVLDLEPDSAFARAAQFESHDARGLRLAKARVALVIALADLTGVRDLTWVTNRLSDFADASVECAMQIMLDKYKLPDWAEQPYGGLFALAMGKHGARELNYSSDIDLVFLFEDRTLNSDQKSELRMLHTKLVRGIVKLLSEFTQDGYVFRTDLRLRPNPSVTPVCQSSTAAHHYYHTEGRSWERAAFIKARTCAGSIRAGELFLNELSNFIWRRDLDFAAMRDIDALLLQSRDHKGLAKDWVFADYNTKLGVGGIRQIEFFAQTQQLMLGGRHSALRQITSLGALNELVLAGQITSDTRDQLAQNYTELREVEHRIQMLHDQQTHRVPNNAQDQQRLAALSGYDTIEAMAAKLATISKTTHALTQMTDRPAPAPDALADHLRERFANVPIFRNPQAEALFFDLWPQFDALIQASKNPDEASASLQKFLLNLRQGVQPMSLFMRRPDILRELFGILILSDHLAENLAKTITQIYGSVEAGALATLPSAKAYQADLAQRLRVATDFEDRLITMRAWKSEEHFRLIVAQITKALTRQDAQLGYSRIARAIMQTTLDLVRADIEAKHGTIDGYQFGIIGMGKLGSEEMTATSDLDIIIVYDHADVDASNGERPLDPKSYANAITRQFINALSAQMAYGQLYEVDMRLRPSGRAGTVATHIDGFDDYQNNKAWVWEHQALTRADMIIGDTDLRKKLENIRAQIIKKRAKTADVFHETIDMRERLGKHQSSDASDLSIKQGLGGTLDIELFAQAMALYHGSDARRPEDQLKLVSHHSEALIATYRLYLDIEHLKRILGHSLARKQDWTDAAKHLVVAHTGHAFDQLTDKLDQMRKDTSRLIETALSTSS